MEKYDKVTSSYLGGLYAEEARSFRFQGSTAAHVSTWSAAARPVLREQIGLDRIRDELGSFEPSVSLENLENVGDHTRQKGVLHAEPGFDVPFWYLEPKAEGPHPIALFPHGHYADHGLDYAAGIAASPEMQRKIEAEDRDVAVQAVRRGFAAIAPSTRGFLPACIPDVTGRHGERNCRSQLIHSLLAGRTVIGERVWDLMCLINWAVSQPDLDDSQILMMGNSGGGVSTLYAAACDERITIAVASCSFCTYVGESGVVHHCDCNTVPGILRFGEYHDVAGLIAPRHLLIVHGRTDPLFPLDEVERAVSGVRHIYDVADAAAAFDHAYGSEGHRFYSDLMWPFVMDALERPGS